MESITENKSFFYSILVASGAVICLISRVIPEFNEQFEIVPIPAEVKSLNLLTFQNLSPKHFPSQKLITINSFVFF